MLYKLIEELIHCSIGIKQTNIFFSFGRQGCQNSTLIYEYYETSWWNFAFCGTLLGNGHTISGLQINGAVIDSDSYRTDAPAMVWHNDGMTCDGISAMFGAQGPPVKM